MSVGLGVRACRRRGLGLLRFRVWVWVSGFPQPEKTLPFFMDPCLAVH